MPARPPTHPALQLELANMYQSGDLHSLWHMARQTDLTFNLVSARRCRGNAGRAWGVGLAPSAGTGATHCRASRLARPRRRRRGIVLLAARPPPDMRPIPAPRSPQLTFIVCCLLLVGVAASYASTRSRPVYLVDFHCYKPPAR